MLAPLGSWPPPADPGPRWGNPSNFNRGAHLAAPEHACFHPSRRLPLRSIHRSALLLILVAGVASLLAPTLAGAQLVTERTPNLSGGWVGSAGTAYFNFLHRFDASDPPARKVTSFPTFLLGYTPVARLLLGMQYATNSDLVASYPNEWEPFARWAAPAMGPARLTLTGAWNNATESFDGEAGLRLDVGPLSLLGAARGFSAGYGDDARFALGGGAVLSLANSVALAGDVITLLDRGPAEEVAWSAAVQVRIPSTPHSLSLQASNTNTGTLEGSSRGGDATRWGFEFTIPITLRRYFGAGGAGGEGVVMTSADTVVVTIRTSSSPPPASRFVRVRPWCS